MRRELKRVIYGWVVRSEDEDHPNVEYTSSRDGSEGVRFIGKTLSEDLTGDELGTKELAFLLKRKARYDRVLKTWLGKPAYELLTRRYGAPRVRFLWH